MNSYKLLKATVKYSALGLENNSFAFVIELVVDAWALTRCCVFFPGIVVLSMLPHLGIISYKFIRPSFNGCLLLVSEYSNCFDLQELARAQLTYPSPGVLQSMGSLQAIERLTDNS